MTLKSIKGICKQICTAFLIVLMCFSAAFVPAFANTKAPADFEAMRVTLLKDGDIASTYAQLQSIAKDTNSYSPRVRAEAYFHLLEIDDLFMDTAAMLEHATNLQQLALQTKSIDDAILSDYYFSQVYIAQFNQKTALTYIDEMEAQAKKHKRTYLLGIAQFARGYLTFRFDDYFKSKPFWTQTHTTLQSANSDFQWFFPYHLTLSNYYNDAANILQKANRRELQPKDMSVLISDNITSSPDEQLRVYFSAGSLYNSFGDFPGAQASFLEAQKILDFFKSNAMIGSIQMVLNQQLASAYYAQNDYKAAADLLFAPTSNGNLNDLLNQSADFQTNIRALESQSILDAIRYQKIALYVSITLILVLLIGTIVIFRENNRIKRLTQEVYQNSITDGLTSLLNRKAIIEKLHIIPREHTAIALIDIDHFKNVNDTYGHLCGDEALITLSQLLKSSIEDKGWAGRFGGEEFMLVIDTQKVGSPFDLVESIRQQIQNVTWSFDLPQLTISVGLLIGVPLDLNQGVKETDRLLYLAKAGGRNCVISNSN